MAELTAAAVVDGIGNSSEVAEVSRLAAQVAARVGVRKGRMAGLLAAAELYGDPGATVVEPDAVAVLALVHAHPDDPQALADALTAAARADENGYRDDAIRGGPAAPPLISACCLRAREGW
ncbi:hypothetical protein ACPEIC_39990 [Stenotrophomonas sp. NPDC087984]